MLSKLWCWMGFHQWRRVPIYDGHLVIKRCRCCGNHWAGYEANEDARDV